MLTIKNLEKYYDKNKLSEQHVLKNINLELPNIGLISIFGPSGCGKTTLLNILSGLDVPSKGEVLFNNERITDQFRYENIGLIFQDFELIDNKTVCENIALGCDFASSKMIDDSLKALDIEKLKNRKVYMLSGGEKQRVAIARAIIKKPAYLIADEPTGNLDLKNSMRIMKILKSLSSHFLILLVSHDKELVEEYSDRIIYLEDGNVIKDKVIHKVESTSSYVKKSSTKFDLYPYLKDRFKMKHKTNFVVLFFMILITTLVCFVGAFLTGYIYKSATIPNEYILFDEPISKEGFEEIRDTGDFIFDTTINQFYLREDASFQLAGNQIQIKNYDFKIEPYQNEFILNQSSILLTNEIPVYITSTLADLILKKGILIGESQSSSFPESLNMKQIHITKYEDLLGGFFPGKFKLAFGEKRILRVVGIVDSIKEAILFDESYFIARHGYTHFTYLPLSKYNLLTNQSLTLKDDELFALNSLEEETTLNIGNQHKNYNIIHSTEELTLGTTKVLGVISDYSYYLETEPILHTSHMKEVIQILNQHETSYTILFDNYKEEVLPYIQRLLLLVIPLSVIFLTFSLFFTLLDTSSYINSQMNDILVLRNLGVTKEIVIKTYTIKLAVKLLPSFAIGTLLGICLTLYLKTYNYMYSYFFQMNGLTILVSMLLGAILLFLCIIFYLISKFKYTAATLKQRHKI